MISSLFDRLDYPGLLQSVYLNQASLGLIGQPAVTAMHTFIDKVAMHGNHKHLFVGGPEGSPRTDKLISASVQSARLIMERVDSVCSRSGPSV